MIEGLRGKNGGGGGGGGGVGVTWYKTREVYIIKLNFIWYPISIIFVDQ